MQLNLTIIFNKLSRHRDILFCIIVCLSHIFFTIFFAKTGNTALCVYNTFFVVLYVLAFFLATEFPTVVFLTFCIIEMLFYSVFSTLFLHINCGMQLITIVMIPSSFFLSTHSTVKSKYHIIMSTLCVLATLFIMLYTGTKQVQATTLIQLRSFSETECFFSNYFVQTLYCFNIAFCAFILIALGASINEDRKKQRAESEERSRYLDFISNHDPLTKLLNRRKSCELAKKLETASQTMQTQWSVSIFDIDNFKKVNDTYGHNAGDKVLKVVADNISNYTDNLLRGIQFSRWGGEEFLLIFPFAGSEPLEILEHIKELVPQEDFVFNLPNTDTTRTINIHLTFGLAFSFQRHRDFEDLINIADEYLRFGKHNGKNRIITEDEYAQGVISNE